MPIVLKLTGENGADAAQQLLDFVGVIAGAGYERQEALASTVIGSLLPGNTADAQTTEPAAKELVKSEPEKEAEPKKEAPKTRKKAEKEAPAEKAADAPAAEVKTDAAPAKEEKAEPVDFVPPTDVTGELKEAEAAPAETQQSAQALYEQFKPAEGQPVTMNYCRALLLHVAAKKGLETGRTVMNDMGVNRVQDLKMEQWADFAKKLEESIA